ncbi:MAG: hypothetical protein OEW64_14345 [Gammaproteobacteria bacterium]|nr:hypothetical protein [Gammaproteobacteria bacterium]MDH5305263.1 hypothetical protein [Gammaproteobacteria bacterium]MDH5323623.1 hypothetical protein [Gammaproteobacteria bacterium]
MNHFDASQSRKRFQLADIFLGVLPLLLVCGAPAHAQAPANDDCANAAVLPGSAPFPPYSIAVDATNATLDAADPLLSCNGAGNNDGSQTVWYSYTPDASGDVDISTVGSTTAGGGELDTAHGAYIGSCGALVEVACVDQGLNDHLNLTVAAGQTYYIKVGQFLGANAAGTVVINVEEPQFQPGLKIIESSFHGTSAPLSSIVSGLAPETLAAAREGNLLDAFTEIPNPMQPEGKGPDAGEEITGSLVPGAAQGRWIGPAKLLQVIDGGNNDDNFDTFGFILSPPDTNGDVGETHYVQMINLLTEIFDKQGNSVLGPFPTSAVFNGLWGQSWCAHSDDGDPVVLYDEETDRWLISQFLATFQDGLCIAISTTGDPTGSYNVYEFDFTGIGFPDYPKFGFATDAVNVMVNLFTPFQGSALGAIDKAEMLNGGPATMVLFTGGLNASLAFGWVPGDNDGPVFDNTLPTFFTTGGFSGGSNIFVAELTPDWADPENTGLSIDAIPVAPFDSRLCTASRGACIPQPGSGTSVGGNPAFLPASTQVIRFLEGIADRLMHRGQTRDFGDRKVAMLNHTVDVDGSGKAGVRWYEMENKKDRGWTLKKQETFSPDSENRWMGSIAMTASGSTCLGYSISSSTTHPSIGITGRKGTANNMNIRELVAFDGNVAGNVQRSSARWGDYSSMSIDPVDDTCWYTQEHAQSLESISPSRGLPYEEVAGWGTKIIQFDVK